MATWARGFDFTNNDNTRRIGGIGAYGTDSSYKKIYIGWGESPWNDTTGLMISSSELKYKNNKIYHAGNKPTLSELGAASSSHNHDSNYLKLSGGTLTGDVISKANIITRFNSADVSFKFINNIPSIRYSGSGNSSTNGFNIVGKSDSVKFRIDESGELFAKGNSKVYHQGFKPTPAEIGAASSSHSHNYAGSSSAGGNANASVKLATARSINGTNFDGTGNITTANWGTTRTLTVGKTGKSVNGSGNISWSLSEIGAAASNHSHSYLPLSGGNLTGPVNNNYSTGTYLAGNQGKTLINSTCSAGAYTMLYKYPSSKGYFTIGGHQSNFLLQYTAKTAVDAGTNSVTKSVTLLNENGDSSFPGKVTASSFSGSLSGNASTATKLKTARTINGTSFNGSANITTSNWGTARTITIGSTGKSVNGSGNVSWSFSELGADAGATANKIVLRDGSGDIKCRLVRSNYANQSTISGAMAFRVNNSSDNCVRFCSDTGAIRSWLGAAASNHSHSYAATNHNHNSVYLKLSGGTISNNLTVNNILDVAGGINVASVKLRKCDLSDTLEISGTTNKSFGAIKLGTGGCRIYGKGDETKLYVEGGIYTNKLFECGSNIISNGTVYPGKSAQSGWDLGRSDRRYYTLYAVNTNLSSDRNMKEDICYIDDKMLKLKTFKSITPFKDFICNDLKIATYKYKRNIKSVNENGEEIIEEIPHEPEDSQIGFIAQDIRNTDIGSLFVYGEDGSMNYSPTGFTAVIAKALQEEIKSKDIIINELNDNILKLQEENNLLKEDINIIKEKLGL